MRPRRLNARGVTSLAVVTLAFAAALLPGCTLAPPYALPVTEPPPATYQETALGWKPARPADAEPRGPWWTLYQNPELDALEDRVTAANENLKAALARLEQARAQTRIARAAFFPTVTLDPSATRYRQSANSPTYVATKPIISNDFTLDADFSYEIDVFGRIRSSVNAARATAQATAADLAVLDLSTHAELASDYFTLRSDDAEQDLLDHTVADYRRALELTENLYNGGAATLADVDQAKAQLETALTQAADTHLRRAQTEHAIAVLIGDSASTFHLDPKPLAGDVLPPAIDPGLPSALLERRPDVAGAERRVAAANAQIGVARAAYFPIFSLPGIVGFESTSASNWISAPSRMWSIGPSAALTVFDGGRRRAQTAQAHAAYDEQVADYRQTVLTAYQDVEDELAALHQLELESVTQQEAVAASSGALQQSQYQYQGGVNTYLQVVVAENAALSARLSAVDIQARRMISSILLIKALGGSWEPPRSPPAESPRG